jgi:hypothetical protein
MTLFEVGIFAGWTVVMNAAYTMTQDIKTMLFFFTYRITINNILLPISVGFLVESFNANQKPTMECQTLSNSQSDNVIHGEDPESTNSIEQVMFSSRVDTANQERQNPSIQKHKYKMSFHRRASDIQSAMFDFSREKLQEDQKTRQIEELLLVIDAKNKELEALKKKYTGESFLKSE